MEPQTPQQPNQNNDPAIPPPNPPAPQPQVFRPNGQHSVAPSPSNPEVTQAPQVRQPSDVNLQPKDNRRPIVIVGVIILLLIAGAVTALVLMKSEQSSDKAVPASSANCIAESQTVLSKEVAIESYKKFADAVKNKDINCADQLSSSAFMERQKITFQAEDGNWITASPGPEPIYKDFQLLPDSLDDSQFTSEDYQRAIFFDESSDSTEDDQVTGIMLSYPVDLSTLFDGANSSHIELSFVLEDGKVKVDELIVMPGSGN